MIIFSLASLEVEEIVDSFFLDKRVVLLELCMVLEPSSNLNIISARRLIRRVDYPLYFSRLVG